MEWPALIITLAGGLLSLPSIAHASSLTTWEQVIECSYDTNDDATCGGYNRPPDCTSDRLHPDVNCYWINGACHGVFYMQCHTLCGSVSSDPSTLCFILNNGLDYSQTNCTTPGGASCLTPGDLVATHQQVYYGHTQGFNAILDRLDQGQSFKDDPGHHRNYTEEVIRNACCEFSNLSDLEGELYQTIMNEYFYVPNNMTEVFVRANQTVGAFEPTNLNVWYNPWASFQVTEDNAGNIRVTESAISCADVQAARDNLGQVYACHPQSINYSCVSADGCHTVDVTTCTVSAETTACPGSYFGNFGG